MKITIKQLSEDYFKKVQLEILKKQREIKLISLTNCEDYLNVNNDIKLLNVGLFEVNMSIRRAFALVLELDQEHDKKKLFLV
jgi:hypothetical protein